MVRKRNSFWKEEKIDNIKKMTSHMILLNGMIIGVNAFYLLYGKIYVLGFFNLLISIFLFLSYISYLRYLKSKELEDVKDFKKERESEESNNGLEKAKTVLETKEKIKKVLEEQRRDREKDNKTL